jgi:hypothetical protein
MRFALFLVATLPLFATTCRRSKYMIHVQNQTAENVYLIPNFNYPDTSLATFSKKVIFANDSVHFVAANYRKPVFYLELCRQAEWRRVVKTDSLQLFVISANMLQIMTSEEIIAKRPFRSQIVISYEDLLKRNCLLAIN